jgi:hypothetical protein
MIPYGLVLPAGKLGLMVTRLMIEPLIHLHGEAPIAKFDQLLIFETTLILL